MAYSDKVLTPLLRPILLLIAIAFAIATTLLIILFTSAATETGSTPFSAISLIDGINSGVLGPGEQRWFRMVPSGQGNAITVEKSLTLRLTPFNDDLNQFITFQLFEEDQIQFFKSDDTSQMSNFGIGEVIVDDNDPTAGGLFWTGSISNANIYFVHISNTSDFSLDYSLITEDISSDVIEVKPAAIEPSQPVAIPEMGVNPSNAITLLPDLNRGRLQPHSISWYRFVYDDFSDGSTFQDLGFTLFFTPDNGNRRHYVNFELFTANEVASWTPGNEDQLTNFGAGMLVSRDGDVNTGERIWKGTILKRDTYYLAIQNGAEVEIDYWLFDDDIYNPELGPKSEPAPAPVFSRGAAPQTAFALNPGRNIGGLEPGQEAWYSFSIHDDDNEFFEEMALTMIVTPDDGNRIHNITFDLFTADGVRNWSPGNNSRINNVGAGGIVVRDNNSLTGERFWSGWVVDNDLYYIQIRNGTTTHIDYWLFTDDVYGPELGQTNSN